MIECLAAWEVMADKRNKFVNPPLYRICTGKVPIGQLETDESANDFISPYLCAWRQFAIAAAPTAPEVEGAGGSVLQAEDEEQTGTAAEATDSSTVSYQIIDTDTENKMRKLIREVQTPPFN